MAEDADGDEVEGAAGNASGDGDRSASGDDGSDDVAEQPEASTDDAGDADQDAPVTAVGSIAGFAVAVLAVGDGDPAYVAALGLAAGVVGLAAWMAIRRERDRDARRGQAAFVAVAAVGAVAALVAEAVFLAAALGLVAVMVAGRLYEKWRA